MLGLSMIVLGAIVFLFVVAFSAYLYLQRHKLGQERTEFKVVKAAISLNEHDRAGQMNYVVARSRELVYLSRLTERQMIAKNDGEAWNALARYLCDEAREGSKLVDDERKHQITLSQNEMGTLAFEYNEASKQKSLISGSFWTSSRTYVDDVVIGSVKNVESNVLHSDTYPELRDYDMKMDYIQSGSDLYRGNINAKLPSPDDDLDFKLCSLAAPTEGSISQARLIQPKVFVPSGACFQDGKFSLAKIDQIPTAVEIKQHIQVELSSGDKQQVDLRAWAASPGAAPPPD